ncbi:MAG: DegT/DnrJ/EryC1/StrS family aminotransferase [Candidatus Chisholmbacteria bacterium]|nr:DegT/DnrJ/EryC1/StrS family aminotransferase [Candidatus Chisholmbacteria bacterium]
MNRYRLPLVKNTISKQDLNALARWLVKEPQLTKGPLSDQFEKMFSHWLGPKYAHYVNSGSSGNLLAIHSLLIAGLLSPGDRVVAPAVSWTTTVAPISQLNCRPILCDCDKENLGLDINHLKKLIKTTHPKAVVVCHVLGIPGHLKEIKALCQKHNLVLIEDCCEALGSLYHGRKVGTFGHLSTFSFYYGHHLSTIEGGMICTNSKKLSNIIRSLRSHGWDRDLDASAQRHLRKKYHIDPFTAKYTFYYPGYNFRANDVGAFLGLRQLRRLDSVINKRVKTWLQYLKELSEATWKPHPPNGSQVSGFSFPLLSPNRLILAETFEKAGVETRPLIGGSVGRQPWYIDKYGLNSLPHAEVIHRFGLYVPVNPAMKHKDVQAISSLALNHPTASVRQLPLL